MTSYKEIEYYDYYKLPSKEGKYKVIRYYTNGNIYCEQYLINGRYHREDGPTVTSYFENGNIYCEQYFISNQHHREDGPAFIEYHKNGNIEYEGYYLCDKKFIKEQYYSQKIQVILDIAKMMNTWESKLNFIGLSLKKELNECL